MKVQIERIKQSLLNALIKLDEEDKYLLEKNASERSIAFRIGHYIQVDLQNCESLHVDVEYNLDKEVEGGHKQLLNPDRNDIDKLAALLKAINTDNYVSDLEKNRILNEIATMSLFYPDLIVHERKINRENRLIVEIKKDRASNSDRKRLKYLTRQNGFDAHFKYQLGVHLVIRTGSVDNNQKRFAIEYFQDGESTGNEDL